MNVNDLWIGAAAILAGIPLLWIWISVPHRWARKLDLSEQDRLGAEEHYRSVLGKSIFSPVAAFGALATIVAALQALYQYRETKEQNFLSKYEKGLAALSLEKAPDRLAAIYSLQLLVQTRPDRSQIVVFPAVNRLRALVQGNQRFGDAGKLANIEAEGLLDLIVRSRNQRALTTLDLSKLELSHLNVAGAVFAQLNLVEVQLDGANLAGADFSGSDLYAANLYFSNLAGATFSGANLTSADLRNAKLNHAKLTPGKNVVVPFLSNGANIRMQGAGADFSHASIRAADFSCSHLTGAFFLDADLPGARFARADIHEARFDNANLAGANLSHVNASGANFHGADLRNANLTGANLDGAILEGATLMSANTSGACGPPRSGGDELDLKECDEGYAPHNDGGCPLQSDLEPSE